MRLPGVSSPLPRKYIESGGCSQQMRKLCWLRRAKSHALSLLETFAECNVKVFSGLACFRTSTSRIRRQGRACSYLRQSTHSLTTWACILAPLTTNMLDVSSGQTVFCRALSLCRVFHTKKTTFIFRIRMPTLENRLPWGKCEICYIPGQLFS